MGDGQRAEPGYRDNRFRPSPPDLCPSPKPYYLPSSNSSSARGILLFDYTLQTDLSTASGTFWSRSLLSPLAPGLLTPFSTSVLADAMGRAWARYRELLGDPLPLIPQDVTRLHQGRLYLDLSRFCQQETAFSGQPSLAYRINGQRVEVVPQARGNMLTNLKFGRRRKRMVARLQELAQQPEPTLARARAWHVKVQEMRWSQAEILQIMEEIERVMAEVLAVFLAARYHLEWTANQLLWLTEASLPFPANLDAFNDTFSDLQGLPEARLAARLLELGDLARQEAPVMEWLAGDSFPEEWQESAPPGPFQEALVAFLDDFGHWVGSAGELRQPRWWEDPTPVLRSAFLCAKSQPEPPARLPSIQARERLLEAVDAGERKEAQAHLALARDLLLLQSHTLQAMATLWSGTRIWVKAAAQEGMVDGRIRETDEVFFFQLEELKQMMTGEWNVSNLEEIRAMLAQRQAQFQEQQAQHPSDLLLDHTEARPVQAGLPGVSGSVSAPLRQEVNPNFALCQGAVVGVPLLDSGWALAFPHAAAFVAPNASPLDPVVAGARLWHTPTVVGLGARYQELVPGAITLVDGNTGHVDQ